MNLELLRNLRGNRSYRQLERETGISRDNLRRYELGLVEPTVSKIIILCEYFHVSSKELLGI